MDDHGRDATTNGATSNLISRYLFVSLVLLMAMERGSQGGILFLFFFC